MMAEEKRCLDCWITLTGRQQKFCSTKCKAHYNNYREVEKECPNCWKTFIWKNYVEFCSHQCAVEFNQNKLLDSCCLYCWKQLTWTQKRFCSRKCKSLYRQKDVKEKVCETCWNTFIWNYKTKYCSEECRLIWKANKTKETSLGKYWCEHPQQCKEIRERAKQTCLEKYWVEFTFQAKEVKEKIQETVMERYWVLYHCMAEKCREASQTISKVNLWRKEYLEKKWFNVGLEFQIKNRSYDLKVWDTLIEINPWATHNANRHPFGEPYYKGYHIDKLKLARDNWYRCIMVRDRDDFDKITYLLDDNKKVIYARNCEVKEISRKDCHDFFEAYHLQWDTRSSKNNIYVWLYYEDTLVECMSFGNPRYNKNYEREILRLCSHKDFRVVWWANRIFNYFLDLTQANSVISYCDMSKFDWRVYEQLWFSLAKWNQPSKHRYNGEEVLSMKHITDNLLRQRWYDQLFDESHGKWTNNEELMLQRGYVEIYDCWQATFIRNK